MMSFWRRLFSAGDKKEYVTVEAPPTNPDWFWSIIEQARHTKSLSQRLIALSKALKPLSEQELIAFYADYHRFSRMSYRWDLWGAAYVVLGGASDDTFDYFRDWLISTGRENFEAVLQDPETMLGALDNLDSDNEPNFEEFRYVVLEVYEKKYGEFPDVDLGAYPADPEGDNWEEDQVDTMFPKLSEWASGRY